MQHRFDGGDGTRGFHYANQSCNLLGEVVSVATGTSYTDLPPDATAVAATGLASMALSGVPHLVAS